MLASRPLVLAVTLFPVMAATLSVLKLDKHHRFDYGLGPAGVFVALGTIAGGPGAGLVGRGVKEAAPRSRAHLDDGADD